MALTALGTVLYFLRGVLAPFAMAVFLNILIAPLISKLQEKGLPKPLAVGVTFLLSALAILLTLGVVASSLSQLLNHADEYEKRFQEILWDILYSVPDRIGEKLDIAEIFTLATSWLKSVLSFITSSFVGLMGQSTVIGLFVVFFLLSDTSQEKTSPLKQKIESKIRSYMTVKVGLSALTAGLTGALLSLSGVDLALVFALITFLLNFIPNIGSILAVVLPLPVLILSPNLSLQQSLFVLAAMVLVQFVIGNLIEPKLIGDKLQLHPVLVLFSLLLWGAVWGILGAVLAIPLTAALKLALENWSVSEGEDLATDEPDSRVTKTLEDPE